MTDLPNAKTPGSASKRPKLTSYLRSLSTDSFSHSPWVSRNNSSESVSGRHSFLSTSENLLKCNDLLDESKSSTSLREDVIPANLVYCNLSPDIEGESPQASSIILSICWRREQLGAAFYDGQFRQVAVLEDKAETAPDFGVLKALCFDLNPRIIIMSGRQETRLFKTVQDLTRKRNHSDNGKGTTSESSPTSHSSHDLSSDCNENGSEYLVDTVLLPAGDCNYEYSKRRILFYKWPFISNGDTDTEREAKLAVSINFNAESAVRALGGLLKYLEQVGRDIIDSELPPDSSVILGLRSYEVNSFLHIDQTTIDSLQIFSEEFHPAAMKWLKSSSSKEGLSLFALLNRTSSPLASNTLRRLMLRPVNDPIVLQKRYQTIEWALRPANTEIVKQMKSCLKNVSKIYTLFARLQKCQMNVRDWKTLYVSLFNIVLLTDICQAQDQNIDILKQIGSKSSAEVYNTTYIIQRAIDFDQSEVEGRFIVKQGLNHDLDQKKLKFNSLGDIMHRFAEEELKHLPSEINTCCINYLPHIGFLLAISPAECEHAANDFTDPEITEEYNIPGLEFKFCTEKLVLFKTQLCYELDSNLGDLQVEIANDETLIMMNLVNAILLNFTNLLSLVSTILQLDVLLAFSVASKDHDWVMPCLSETKGMKIVEGRHPLYELCNPSFVFNDTTILEEKPISILTGPNSSGKTVYIKQIGVIAYLVHIGCFVPAKSVSFFPFDAIITVTQNVPSVISGVSSFMMELKRLSVATTRATGRSLVLMDEFGLSTYENDGAALLAATLNFWIDSTEKQNCPAAFVSTHFLDLRNHLIKQNCFKYLTMHTMEDEDGIVPLYKIIDGFATESHSIQAVKLCGLSERLLRRAVEVRNILSAGNVPSRWSVLEDEMEQKKCQAITEVFLNFETSGGRIGNLLHKLQEFIHPEEWSHLSTENSLNTEFCEMNQHKSQTTE